MVMAFTKKTNLPFFNISFSFLNPDTTSFTNTISITVFALLFALTFALANIKAKVKQNWFFKS